MPNPVRRTGGQRVAYPGKERKSINLQLTKTQRLILRKVKAQQKKQNFKDVNREPSTGDVFGGYLEIFGTQLILPPPRRP